MAEALLMLSECCWRLVRSQLLGHFGQERPVAAASLNASISFFALFFVPLFKGARGAGGPSYRCI